MLLLGQNLVAQNATTFTTTNLKVTDTLTSVNMVKAHEIVATETITAKDDIVAEQDIRIAGALTVTSTATFKSTINTDQGINFGGNSGMRFLGTNSAGQSFLRVGPNQGSLVPPPTPICPTPASNYWWMQNYGGYISSHTGGGVNASLSMFTAAWNGNGHIDVHGVSELGQENNGLLLNYFCGRDAYICTNAGLSNGGGKVLVGNFLQARQHVEIGEPTFGIAPNNSPGNNVALDLHVNNGKAIKARTYNGTLSMFEIENYGGNQTSTTFKIDGNGRTYIGVQKPKTTGPHANAMLSVDGKILAKEIYVNIHNTVWADYVFDKSYKLMPLNEVEKYISNKKHLPNVPSQSELLEKDLNLAEMQKIQMEKIEELYLYVIEQQKQIDALKAENKALKQTSK